MSVVLVLPDPLAVELAEKARLPNETAGVLLARPHRTANGDMRLLGRSLHWAPQSAYLQRSPREMTISPEGYVDALGLAERDNAVPLWVHTHPIGDPLPSERDHRVDATLADVFRLRSGSPFYGTVIVSPDDWGGRNSDGVKLTGTLQRDGEEPKAIERFWIIGSRWRLVHGANQRTPSHCDELFDRNVRAFGAAVQQTIGALRIAIVGAGGTGSSVAEQLVRLGARDLLLVDPDTLSTSNVTRVYGSTPQGVGEPKVDTLARHLGTIAPNLRCVTVQGMCTSEAVARTLADADLIFGCTDDNAGRLVLSRLAVYHLIPLIDMGVLLSSDERGHLNGVDGRITVVSPGDACLVCRDRIDTVRAASEMKTPEERNRLEDEGYAPALGRVEPAVVSFTTMVAAAAINELLERLVGYGDACRPSEILLRLHDRELSTNVVEPRLRHYCHPSHRKLGLGDTEPFLDQTWAA